MDAEDLDLNLLVVMQAVGLERNITRAARRLGLSQPAVSGAIARLRRALGDPLFVRSSQGMEPTPRARHILEAVDVALGLIRVGLHEGEAFEPSTAEATFTILMSDLGELVYLPRLIAHLQLHAPRTVLRVRPLSSGGHAGALESGAADLAIGYIPNPRGSLRSRRLFTDRFVCMVRDGHPARQQALTLDSYLALDHAIVARRGASDGMVTAALAGMGKERRVAVSLPHSIAAPSLVAATDLAVTVPSILVRLNRASRLAGLELPFALPPITLALYWHERQQHDAASRWLRHTMVALFGDTESGEAERSGDLMSTIRRADEKRAKTD